MYPSKSSGYEDCAKRKGICWLIVGSKTWGFFFFWHRYNTTRDISHDQGIQKPRYSCARASLVDIQPCNQWYLWYSSCSSTLCFLIFYFILDNATYIIYHKDLIRRNLHIRLTSWFPQCFWIFVLLILIGIWGQTWQHHTFIWARLQHAEKTPETNWSSGCMQFSLFSL